MAALWVAKRITVTKTTVSTTSVTKAPLWLRWTRELAP
jgi:hypothetical protein